MTNSTYLSGRKRYGRAQAMLWSENLGELVDGFYIPTGYEVGAIIPEGTDESEQNQFLILSDHNRSEMQFSQNRIESKQRMVNGRMRSYHIADKLNISVSWNMLPSRSYKEGYAFFGEDGKAIEHKTSEEYTVDAGAGGLDILKWYNSHPGPFWVYLAYDAGPLDINLYKYSQIVQMYFKDFSYDVVKRGNSTHDYWNITVSLEEV
jgi:hypothetical protein